MRHDDPLDELELRFLDRFMAEHEMHTERLAELRAATRTFLDGVADHLDHPLPRHTWYDIHRWDVGRGVGLAVEDVPRAQALYPRVMEAGGTGSRDIQETLLNLIRQAEDPASVPFWVGLLEYARPRDQFGQRRRLHALAGLARLVIRRADPTALAALRAAMHHRRDDIRALAAHYLGRALLYEEYTEEETPEEASLHLLPSESLADDADLVVEADTTDQTEDEELPPVPIAPDLLAELNEIAVSDPVFGPRFQARSLLRDTGHPVPLDNPDGVYAFKVSLARAGVSRTIELRSTQTLDDLHFAIQKAFEWDGDHLYTFYMTGEEDRLYAFACPYEDEYPPWADEAIIGELGIVKGHTFGYLFDYGDNHWFTIKVADIRPEAGRYKYPRIVDKSGKSPEQYPEY
jgi:hypothetical protein